MRKILIFGMVLLMLSVVSASEIEFEQEWQDYIPEEDIEDKQINAGNIWNTIKDTACKIPYLKYIIAGIIILIIIIISIHFKTKCKKKKVKKKQKNSNKKNNFIKTIGTIISNLFFEDNAK